MSINSWNVWALNASNSAAFKRITWWLNWAIFYIVAILCFGTVELVLAYYHTRYEGWTIYLIARILQLQILVNALAFRLNSHKDGACYQMKRVGITPERLTEIATKTCLVQNHIRPSHKFCQTCKQAVPFRSVHCRFCELCVLRNDHHCFVSSMCHGIGTYRYFFMTAFYVMVTCAWALLEYVNYARDKTYDDGTWSTFFNSCFSTLGDLMLGSIFLLPHLFGPRYVFYLCLAFVFNASGIIFFHCYLMYRGGLGWKDFGMKLPGDGGTLIERIRFVHGSRFMWNWVFPRFWEDVEWNETFIRSVITHPLDGMSEVSMNEMKVPNPVSSIAITANGEKQKKKEI